MIQGQLDKEQLAHQISHWGQELLRERQVYSRLLHLLPARYSETVKRIRQKESAGKARRLALMDPNYLAYIEELNQLGHRILSTKVEWDTHRLLYRCKAVK